MTKKTPAALNKEIQEYMGKSTAGVFWPGGAGGGSSARKRPGSPVVKPHARTSPTCKKCSRYHTTEEHDQHGEATSPRSTPSRKTKAKTASKTRTAPTRTKAKKKAKAKAKPKTKTKAKKKAKAKAKPKTRAKAKAETATPVTQDALAVVTDAIKRIPASGRFGRDKVFISAIWKRARKKIGMSLPEFKDWLVVNNRKGNLTLARADLIGAMNPQLVRDSEIHSLGATFHFVLDPTASW